MCVGSMQIGEKKLYMYFGTNVPKYRLIIVYIIA